MAGWFRKAKLFAKEVGKEVLTELLADWLKKLLCTLVTTGLFVWVIRFLRTEISIRIPLGIIFVFACFWLAMPLITVLILRRRRMAQWTGMRECNGLLWNLDQGKVVGGPFCPRCKGPLEQVPRNFDQQMELLLDFAKDSSYPVTRLRCPRCGVTYSFNQSLDALKQHVEAQASAHLR